MSKDPRQLRLPFDNTVRPRRAEPSPLLHELLQRLVRVESRIIQLMKHQGMTTDGRQPLQTDEKGN